MEHIATTFLQTEEQTAGKAENAARRPPMLLLLGERTVHEKLPQETKFHSDVEC